MQSSCSIQLFCTGPGRWRRTERLQQAGDKVRRDRWAHRVAPVPDQLGIRTRPGTWLLSPAHTLSIIYELATL